MFPDPVLPECPSIFGKELSVRERGTWQSEGSHGREKKQHKANPIITSKGKVLIKMGRIRGEMTLLPVLPGPTAPCHFEIQTMMPV